MPTPNPRINVTLRPELDAAIAELAALQGSSKSAVVRELLEQVEPMMRRVASLLRYASTAQKSWQANFLAELESAQSQVETYALAAMDEYESVEARLRSEGAQTSSSRPQPPSTNRGVTHPAPAKSKRAKKAKRND